MYNFKQTEKKWQAYWEKNKTYKTTNDTSKPKFYALDMFPYPSGAGLHVGHPEWYTANDIVSRYKKANGFNVLHPMGWDAFGLPAENYAIKTGTHPKITTAKNIETFKKQIQALWFSYDWDREIDTTNPKYYKWTQWIFAKMFEKGLAYEQDLPINFCPSCKTGLANEEVLSNGTCDRCGTNVEKRKIRQWVLAITKYADRLEKDVDDVDWPEGIKDMQKKWIGRSEGCEFEMKKDGDESKKLSVYTTRLDTVFGMTYAVIAPDHKDIQDFIDASQKDACEKYILDAKNKSDLDRTGTKEKTWVFTGSYIINPFNNTKIPLYIGDYVLGNYGTGAVMAVPAHDERDFEFAKKMGIDIVQSIAPRQAYTWVNASRPDVETLHREVIDVILENEKGEFLLLYEENPLNHHFIGGGVETGETELEALKKEIIEESGYTDFEIVWAVNGSYISSFGFRHTKQKNQDCMGRFFHVKLKSEKQVPSEIDDGHHKMAWFKKEEVAKLLSWPNHSSAWELFLNGNICYTQDGILVNSWEFNGLTSLEAREKLSIFAQENGFGTKKVNYKLRDWLFSRQRYWGEPIPLIHIDLENLKKLPHIDDISKATDKNLAYILKRDTKTWEESCQNAMCHGKVRELVIDGKVFSKIYDGLYTKIVVDYRLPLELPEVEKFEPSPDGQSPLARVDDFVNVKLADNLSAKRETNTMPQWGWSCWYYLRFMDRENPEELVNSDVEKYWWSVDSYVGWAEHAVLHLLYARFWHKFLYDIGVVSTKEPFGKLRNQGLILAFAYQNKNGGLIANDLVKEENGKYFHIETWEELSQIVAKMSKSLKNVVNPDDIVNEYGADSLRLYEMYMSDFKDAAPWDTKNITWVYRFLEKVWNLFEKGKIWEKDEESMKLLHKTIKKVWDDIENYKFNTAIASLMILVNYGHPKDETLAKEWKSTFARLIHPFAPHIAEELWEMLGNSESIFLAAWPKYDEAMTKDDVIVIWVQILGKLRGELEINVADSKEDILSRAKQVESVQKWLEGKEIVKEIYVPGKIVNIVIK